MPYSFKENRHKGFEDDNTNGCAVGCSRLHFLGCETVRRYRVPYDFNRRSLVAKVNRRVRAHKHRFPANTTAQTHTPLWWGKCDRIFLLFSFFYSQICCLLFFLFFVHAVCVMERRIERYRARQGRMNIALHNRQYAHKILALRYVCCVCVALRPFKPGTDGSGAVLSVLYVTHGLHLLMCAMCVFFPKGNVTYYYLLMKENFLCEWRRRLHLVSFSYTQKVVCGIPHEILMAFWWIIARLIFPNGHEKMPAEKKTQCPGYIRCVHIW